MAQFDRLPNGERSLWLARWRRKRESCPECGNPVRDCSDPKRHWHHFRSVCYATMEREAANAVYDKLHEDEPFHDGSFTRWAKERSRSFPFGHNEGVTINVAGEDLAPWDKFLTDVAASPVPHEAPAGEAEVHEGEQPAEEQ